MGTSDGIQLLVSGLDRYVRQLGGDTGKAFVVNRGVDLQTFQPGGQKDLARREFGIRPEDVMLLFVGRLDTVKGVPYLLEAARRVLAEHANVKLLIVGDGSLREAYEEMARGFEGRIIFAGYRSDVPELMRAADIFVLSSLSEGAANVVMEASASGLAVVATGVGEIPEIVEDRVTGLLVKPKDPEGIYAALTELIDNPGLVREMGVAGRKRMIDKYGWEVVCRQVDENYSRVVERYARNRRTKTGS
jgi:glycosyltransferase involved in cell wall biosynthesis